MGIKPLFSRRSLLAGAAAVFGRIACTPFSLVSGACWIPFRKQPPCEGAQREAGARPITVFQYDSDGRLLSKVESAGPRFVTRIRFDSDGRFLSKVESVE
jgi:hypothetical protein